MGSATCPLPDITRPADGTPSLQHPSRLFYVCERRSGTTGRHEPKFDALLDAYGSPAWRVSKTVRNCRAPHENLTMLVLLIAICILSGVHATKLERVHDEDLLNLIKVEKYVIVLFSKFVSFILFFFPGPP